MLWTAGSDGEEQRFLFNSAIQESVNSIFYRLGPCVKKMSATLNKLTMTVNALVHNELLTREKTLQHGARFRS